MEWKPASSTVLAASAMNAGGVRWLNIMLAPIFMFFLLQGYPKVVY